MQPEEREMLKKTLEFAQENNKMLHEIRRSMFWGRMLRIVYWTLIIGGAVGVYYYVEPYLESAIGAYGSVKNDLQSVGNFLSP